MGEPLGIFKPFYAFSITTSPFLIKKKQLKVPKGFVFQCSYSYTFSIALFGGLTVRRGLEASILGWAWSCAHCVGNIWLTVFVCGDVGATNSAGVAGCPIRSSCWWR